MIVRDVKETKKGRLEGLETEADLIWLNYLTKRNWWLIQDFYEDSEKSDNDKIHYCQLKKKIYWIVHAIGP